ncbi:MAG TPA: HepT-like ribonuclease domain-containing protein [Longimicrobium sp.]|nr:HepT-like ribonuclease domain-containing protein [Longimicrobium sp.]HSU15016.1 HepT-like ribonuclease domain-containing protein [Longimicrobium sp.]
MSFSPREYLRHMLVEIDFLLDQTRTRSQDDVLADPVLRRAIVRSIEIIGEAARQVPEDFRARHPQIKWRLMRACGTG